MTTDALIVVRGELRDWPLVAGVPLAPGTHVLSVEARVRAGGGGISASLARLCQVIAKAVSGHGLDHYSFVLAVSADDVPTTALTATGLYHRRRVWVTWEREGYELPEGLSREERNVSQAGTVTRYAGVMWLRPDELATGLSLTARHRPPGLLFAVPSDVGSKDALEAQLWELLAVDDLDAPVMLREALTRIWARGWLVLRAHGGFDDPAVAVDVFGDSSALDSVDAALAHA